MGVTMGALVTAVGLIIAILAGASNSGLAADGVIYGCVNESWGVLRVVSEEQECANGERRIAWNIVGAQGPAGEPGIKGRRGPRGPRGPHGLQGPAGVTGVKGDTGPTGPLGPQGSQGLQGAAGAAGAKGDTGPTGSTGPQGPPGDLLSGFIIGTVETCEQGTNEPISPIKGAVVMIPGQSSTAETNDYGYFALNGVLEGTYAVEVKIDGTTVVTLPDVVVERGLVTNLGEICGRYAQLGNQGCTPGYWKNHTDSWPPTGYSPSQSVLSVFAGAIRFPQLGTATLVQALSFGGGPGEEGAAEILLRAGVAALLNAAHPSVSYPRTLESVIADVNAALTNTRDAMLALAAGLDADNNMGCPLN
jgi:hypothetical protein